MKIPWKKKVSITIKDVELVSFIKCLLSSRGLWTYKSITQELEIFTKIKDMQWVREEILTWLKGRI